MLQFSRRAPLRLLSLALFAVATVAPTWAQAPRRVFVLAGQSNTADLRLLKGIGCGIPGVPPPNVSYAEAKSNSGPLGPYSLTPIPLTDLTANSRPLLALGNRLGVAFPNEQVELVMIAQSGSALLARNFIPALGVNGAWADPATPSNPFAWMNLMGPVMQGLNLGPADRLHIVWGQGESDCLVTQTTTTQEYIDWAQIVFAALAGYAGKSQYDVHLVTLGALYSSIADPILVDRIRDAFFRLPTSAAPLPWVQATIRPAAHHYDLEHRDAVHLTPCASIELAERIADGILTPGLLALRSSAPAFTTINDEIVIPTTVNLTPMPLGQDANKFFSVTVGTTTLSPSDFEVTTSGSQLILQVLTGGVFGSPFSVRYVAGSGLGLDWQTMPTPTDAVLGLPLEPFVAP